MADSEPARRTPLIPIRLRAVLRRSELLRKVAVRARPRGLRKSDFFFASYPRSGNTWLRFVLADLVTGAPVDFEGVDQVSPSVGFHAGAPEFGDGARLIKTHEPYQREYRRGVYIYRDVRDVLVSFYRVTRADPNDLGDLDQFVEDFSAGRLIYGSWQDHVRGWLAAAEKHPILIKRFEELRSDPEQTVVDIAAAAGIEADRTRAAEALNRNSSEAMHQLEAKNAEYLRRSFGYQSRGVRAGAVGGWRELLSDRHLELLEPALKLNRELGYPD